MDDNNVEVRVFSVEKRDANTLLPIIEKHVRVGTMIHSDEWRAYNRLSSLGYEHQTVNHSENFVNPENESQESFVQLQNTTNKLHGRINFSFDSVGTGNSIILSKATEEMLVHMLKMLGKRRRML